jgi:1-acyl-sn-glycerol-3-phosphate acyltransferase
MEHPTQDRSLIQFGQAAAQVLQLFAEASLAPADTLTGWSLDDRDPPKIERMLPFFEWFYRDYFQVQTDGWENIPTTGKVLLVGSHNGGLAAPDTVMFTYDWMRRFGPTRPAYALMEPTMWQVFPGVAHMAVWVGCVQASSQMAVQALRRDAALLIYPGEVRDVFRSHHLRDKVCFFGNKGFIKLALLEEAPIVPLISYGAHDTLYVIADLYPQLAELHRQGLPWPFGLDPGTFPIYLGLPWGLSFGPLPNIPLPRQLHTRVCPPIVFDRYGHQASHDEAYVDACYQQVRSSMQHDLDQLFAAHA